LSPNGLKVLQAAKNQFIRGDIIMKSFKEAVYEANLYAFGKTLAKYNAFTRDIIIKDIGKEILWYLKNQGFDYEEKDVLSDIENVMNLYVNNGFVEKLEIEKADHGNTFIWHNLYGMDAYKALQDVTDNPFISCPLNACLSYLADKQSKMLVLYNKNFDVEKRITISQEEIIDKNRKEDIDLPSFDSLIIENARLYELAEQRARRLEKEIQMRETMDRELEKKNEELNILARNDALTGICNRYCFIDYFSNYLEAAKEYSLSFGLLFMDLDGFKKVNDKYGHSVGDEVLKISSNKIKSNIRQMDLIGRFGGDEFVVLLKNIKKENINHLAKRIIDSFKDPIHVEENIIHVGISIGIALYPEDGNDLDTLIHKSDLAMYNAKAKGKNTVMFFNSR
jgi:diguanylate cyclase (GGDEF)-like protein